MGGITGIARQGLGSTTSVRCRFPFVQKSLCDRIGPIGGTVDGSLDLQGGCDVQQPMVVPPAVTVHLSLRSKLPVGGSVDGMLDLRGGRCDVWSTHAIGLVSLC